ncbi:MAG TPA: non-canonical purine NTP pyrophosphatase [Chloroflexota bacterium]|jgi:inosine/xanthosine triphosphate pyrophosphatase family protein
MKDLLLATSNPAKLVRLRLLLEGMPFRLLAPTDLGGFIEPVVEETGADFAANASLKAAAWSEAAGGLAALASDGGMAIPALGARWDALRTRRQAGSSANDEDRIAHLLKLMAGLAGEDRHAVWYEAIALAAGGAVRSWTERGDGGLIAKQAPEVRREGGFWTEEVRWYPDVGKLLRDCSEAERERINDVWPRLATRVRAALSSYPLEEGWP